MKGLLEATFQLLIRLQALMALESARRRASKAIARVEKDGGYVLSCGCHVAARSSDLRRMMENCGPERVLELESDLAHGHDRAIGCGTRGTTGRRHHAGAD